MDDEQTPPEDSEASVSVTTEAPWEGREGRQANFYCEDNTGKVRVNAEEGNNRQGTAKGEWRAFIVEHMCLVGVIAEEGKNRHCNKEGEGFYSEMYMPAEG